MASLGLRSMDEAIGRADMLAQVSRGNDYLDDLDLNPMLVTVDGAADINYDRDRLRQSVPDTLDASILDDAEPFFKHGEKCSCHMQFKIRRVRLVHVFRQGL